MEAQQYEDRSNVRIKFASIDDNGMLMGDSHHEYETLFDDLPEQWSVEEAGVVTTSQEGDHRAWILRSETEELIAVEHETGVEILVGVGVNVISTGVVAFAGWAWKKWRDSRAQGIQSGNQVEPSLVVESVEDRFPDGRSRVTRRVQIRGPLDAGSAQSALERFT